MPSSSDLRYWLFATAVSADVGCCFELAVHLGDTSNFGDMRTAELAAMLVAPMWRHVCPDLAAARTGCVGRSVLDMAGLRVRSLRFAMAALATVFLALANLNMLAADGVADIRIALRIQTHSAQLIRQILRLVGSHSEEVQLAEVVVVGCACGESIQEALRQVVCVSPVRYD